MQHQGPATGRYNPTRGSVKRRTKNGTKSETFGESTRDDELGRGEEEEETQSCKCPTTLEYGEDW